jgi:uncharacterized membrane protein
MINHNSNLLRIFSLMVPAIMVGFGSQWRRRAPKTINSTYGYRTTWSEKSQETWEFAHKYVGKIWLYTGISLGITTIVLLVIFRNRGYDVLGDYYKIIMFIQTAILCLTIVPTEVELRKKFDENGNRK